MIKNKTFIDHDKNQLSQNQSLQVVKRYQLEKKIKNVHSIIYMVYKTYGEMTIKELYYKGEGLLNLIGIPTISSFRQFCYRHKINLTHSHIINTYTTSSNKYVEVLDIN